MPEPAAVLSGRVLDLAGELRDRGARVGGGVVLVVLSDGWDPAELAAEMPRLRRCAHRVIWLTPLAADPRLFEAGLDAAAARRSTTRRYSR